MSTINISDLRPTGFELFSDSEGYMNELGDSEFDGIYGGLIPALLFSVARLTVQRAAAGSSMRCLNASLAVTKQDPGQAGGLSHAVSQISRLIF